MSITLFAENCFSGREISIFFHTQKCASASPHNHNFYELFVVTQGKVPHVCSGSTHLLCEGEVRLISPSDIHYYAPAKSSGQYEFINIAFRKEVFDLLAMYLGTRNIPTGTHLDADGIYTIKQQCKQAIETGDNGLLMRILLFDLMKNLLKYPWKTGGDWFDSLLLAMQKKENYTAGVHRIYELSGRSPEHICRVFQQRLGTTPTQFITEKRLAYAQNLLISTRMSATDICYECGFESLSWFYRLFVAQNLLTPAKYRKTFSLF